MATAFKQVKNNAKSFALFDVLNNTTSPLEFGIEPSNGAKFPDTADGSFWLTAWNISEFLDPGDDPNMRIGLCTVRDVDDFTVTWGQFGTPINAIPGRPAVAILALDQHLIDIQTAINNLEEDRQYKIFLTVGTADSDYITDGTADNVQIQAAVDAANSAGGGIVFLQKGTYQLAAMVTLYQNVKLVGAGFGKSIVTISASFSGGVMFRDNSGDADNIEVTGITFDASGKTNVGYLHIYKGDNVKVHNNRFTGASCSDPNSKWGVRLGHYVDGNGDDIQSRNVRFCDNLMDNTNTGTFEQLLFVNQRSGYIQNNVWRDNTNSLAYEVMLYVNNVDVDVSGNDFESPNAHSIGVMESKRCDIHHNKFHFDGSFNAVTVINSRNISIERNTGENDDAANTGFFVHIFDRALGPDGFTQIVPDSKSIVVRNNDVTGWKHVVSSQIVGTVSGSDYTMNLQGLTIEGNNVWDCRSVPFILGANNAANFMKKVFIRHNNVFSWVAGSSGAVQLRGYTTDVTQMSDIIVKQNYVAPASDGGTLGAVRVIACTVKEVSNNNFEGVSGDGITTATGGVVTKRGHNAGTTDTNGPLRSFVTVCRSGFADFVCDGTADDVQIQAAIAQVAAAGGGTVYLRAGLYRLAATVTLPFDGKVRLIGEKMVKGSTGGVTLKTAAGSTLTDLFSIVGNTNPVTNADLTHDFGFEHITFDGNSTTTNIVTLSNVDFCTFNYFRMINATNSIKTVWDSSSDPVSATQPGGLFISNGIVSANSGIGMDLQYQTQCWVTNVWFSGTSVTDWMRLKSCNKIHVMNCEFNTATNAIRFQDTATAPCHTNTFLGNVFAVGSGNKAWKEERTHASSYRTIITGSVIQAGVTYDALVNDNNLVLNSDGILSISQLILATATPSSASDTGTAGRIAWDSDYIYVCVATDTWKRVAISTW